MSPVTGIPVCHRTRTPDACIPSPRPCWIPALWLSLALCLAGLSTLAPRLAAADSVQPWKFMVTGDSRGSWTPINDTILTELAAEALRLKPDFVLFTGDLVYSGSLEAFESWKTVMADVYDAGIGVYPIMGNHDSWAADAFTNVLGATLPSNGPEEAIRRTYFVPHKNVLVLALDQFTSPVINQPWIDSVLATYSRPHVFAMGHLPAFKLAHEDCLDDYPEVRDAFWKSLKAAGCHAYFCGHDHFYDHCILDEGIGTLDNQVRQFIVGTGGAPTYGDGEFDGDNSIWNPVRIYHEANYGYMLVEINGPYATLTWMHRTGEATYEPTDDSWSYRANPPISIHISPVPSTPTQLRLWFNADKNLPYTIEASTDLTTWTPIARVTPADGLVQFDIDSTENPYQFFRAR